MSTIIDNSAVVDTIGTVGEPNTAYYAQTFTAAGTKLNDITLYSMQSVGSAPTKFDLLITTLNPSGSFSPGQVLFESGVQTLQAGATFDVSIDTGSLALTPGTEYAFILDAYVTRDGAYDSALVGTNANYTGGSFYYYNDQDDIGRNASFGMNFNGPLSGNYKDLAFSALFDGSRYQISTSAPSLIEGTPLVDDHDHTVIFTVTRDDSASASTVAVSLSGTATGPTGAGPDYSVAGLNNDGTLSFAAGATTASFAITTKPDARYEADETVVASLGLPSDGGTVPSASGSATTTITDDDSAPVFSISDAPTVTESGQLFYTVTRTGDAQADESVTVTTGGAGDTATADADYTSKTQALTFVQGASTAIFAVQTSADALYEGGSDTSETLTATLSDPTDGATISPTGGSATGEISDGDTAPTLAIGPASITHPEGASGGTAFNYTVTRTGDAQTNETVQYAVTGMGTKPADAADFTGGALPSGLVTFAQGQTTQTITVSVAGDGEVEHDEGFNVTVSSPNFGTVTQTTATGTILNDDLPAAGSGSFSAPTDPTTGSDHLTGTLGSDVIAGLAGNDTIDGGAGDNLILGNQGHDRITVGDGRNTVHGGQDDDVITAGGGNNLLFGEQGADTITTGDGDNTVVGGIDSADGADRITTGAGRDLIIGNGGDDSVSAGGGRDSVVGGFGNDVLLGNQGDDVVLGNQGNDDLFGGFGDDVLHGGQGDDTLTGGQGKDLLFGNQGSNRFVFNTGDTSFASGTGMGDIVGDFKSGTDSLHFASGPAGTASNFGAARTTSTDFGSVQALAQQLLSGGDTYAFVSDGVDGFLFTSAGGQAGSITNAFKLAGVTNLQARDVA